MTRVLINKSDITNSTTVNVVFTNIPQTYKHLELRYSAKGTNSATQLTPFVYFNSDSGANYSNHFLAGDGASVSNGSQVSATSIQLAQASAATATANYFGAGVMSVQDYSSTSKFKTTSCYGGVDLNGSGSVRILSGSWRSLSAITTFQASTANGSIFFVPGSSFYLYGVTG
jgi:hypothetical protein